MYKTSKVFFVFAMTLVFTTVLFFNPSGSSVEAKEYILPILLSSNSFTNSGVSCILIFF